RGGPRAPVRGGEGGPALPGERGSLRQDRDPRMSEQGPSTGVGVGAAVVAVGLDPTGGIPRGAAPVLAALEGCPTRCPHSRCAWRENTRPVRLWRGAAGAACRRNPLGSSATGRP